MAATNINRVVITGNLTARPRASLAAQRHLRLQAARRRATRAARTTRAASGSTSPTTSTSPSGAPRARTARATCPRAARSRSTAAWSGASGRRRKASKRQAVDIIADTVQFLAPARRRRRRRRQRLHARGRTSRSTRATSPPRRPARAPRGPGGRRHPVLAGQRRRPPRFEPRARPGLGRSGDVELTLPGCARGRGPVAATRTARRRSSARAWWSSPARPESPTRRARPPARRSTRGRRPAARHRATRR